MFQPCKRDCPHRSGECHSICPEWALWEQERNAVYDARVADRRSNDALYSVKNNVKKINYRKTKVWR